VSGQLLQLNLPEASTYKFQPSFILMLEATSFVTVLLLAVQEVEEECLLCYHDNSKLHASIFTKLGLYVQVVTISS